MTGATENLDTCLDGAVFVALGANLSAGGRGCVEALAAAMDELDRRGVRVLARSRPWRSAAWPDARQPAFVNAVVRVAGERTPAPSSPATDASSSVFPGLGPGAQLTPLAERAGCPEQVRGRRGKRDFSPAALLMLLHEVEATFGRQRGEANAPRTLDLDLIAYGRRVEPGPPVLPHPRATERLFVMGPLAEIAPDWRHPISGLTAQILAETATVGRDAAPFGAWPEAAKRA